MRRGVAGLTLALLLGGCGETPTEPQPGGGEVVTDGGEPVTPPPHADAALDDSGLRMEVGTGAHGAWRSFENGDTLWLQRGIQGAQHVYVSFRVRDAAPGPIDFRITIERERDGMQVNLPYGYPVEMDRQLDERTSEITGLTAVVPVPAEILAEDVRIVVWIADVDGATRTVTRFAHIVWGPDSTSGTR